MLIVNLSSSLADQYHYVPPPRSKDRVLVMGQIAHATTVLLS